MFDLIIAFTCGVFVTLLLLVVGVLVWFNSQSTAKTDSHITKGFEPFIRPQLPQHLEQVFADLNGPEGTQISVETCCWFNLIADFLFRELRDSTFVKGILMKKINAEFEELLLTKTEGKMIEQLTVRDYFLGTSVPVVKDVTVVRIDCSPENDKEPTLIDVAMTIDYSGGGEMKIDADLVFNKSAYVAVKILSVKGQLRLRFCRLPYTHWSFSFYEEPELCLKVDSHFEGRSYPQLSSFIENQLRRFVRKKYTLPACKPRHKPFFRKIKPQDQLLEVYVKDKKLTVGELQVEVVDCSRLTVVDSALKTYCSVAVATSPYKPRVNLWRTQWPTHELLIPKDSRQKIGIQYRMVTDEDKMDRSQLVVVHSVVRQSEAMAAGILVGDVLIRINNVRVSSVRQVERLIQKSKGNSVLVTLQRPPAHVTAQICTPRVQPSATVQPLPVRTADTVGCSEPMEEGTGNGEDGDQSEVHHSADEGISIQARMFDSDSISLCGVGGERGLGETGHIEGLRLRRHPVHTTHTRNRSVTPESVESSNPETPALTVRPRSRTAVNEMDLVSDTTAESSQQGLNETSAVSGATNGQGTQHVTREVDACKNPSWSQAFTFKIAEEHNYLNVCIWNKLSDESGDLLIGHVTIPLMDVALECLCTSAGYHHQRYVLVAAQTLKPSASRSALQATSSANGNSGNKESKKKMKEKLFAGDILLRFKHQPNTDPDTVQNNVEMDSNTEARNEPSDPLSFTSHPFTPSEGNLPSDHFFITEVDTEGTQVCDICQKKIWSLKSRLMRCQKCNMKCHKKCANYCKREVPCHGHSHPGDVSVVRLCQTVDGEFTMLEVEEDSDREHDNGHRLLQQQQTVRQSKNSMSSSFEFVDGSDDDDSDQKGYSKSGASDTVSRGPQDDIDWGKLLETNSSDTEEMITPPESSCGSPVESFHTRQTPDEDKIQLEIDHLNQLVNSSLKKLNDAGISEEEKMAVRSDLVEYEGKIESLTVSMRNTLQESDICQ